MATKLASGSKGPVAVILSGEEIEWMSCRSILPNLLDAYRLVFKKNLKTFCLRRGTSHREVLLLAKKIAALRPASVVFLGYRYQPARLIVALNLAWGDKPASPIFIHIYGNFTRQS
ncbi:MAG: hypothetical protein ACXVA9_14195, partial [Bdellovibrionales bacterium]